MAPRHQHGCTRAARTDKGVHAAGNVMAIKVMMGQSESPDDVVARINQHLPPDIRVLAAMRVTRAFNSKSYCEQRRYEYLLPTFTLAPLGTFAWEGASELPDGFQTGQWQAYARMQEWILRRRAEQERKKAGRLAADVAWRWEAFKHPLPAPEPAAAAASSMASTDAAAPPSAMSSSAAPTNAVPSSAAPSRLMPSDAAPTSAAAPSGTIRTIASPAARQHERGRTAPPAPVSAAPAATLAADADAASADAAAAGSASMPARMGSDELYRRMYAFRAAPSLLAKMRAALGMFKGTHNFHNYTRKMPPADPRANRYMLSFTCSDPFVVDGACVQGRDPIAWLAGFAHAAAVRRC